MQAIITLKLQEPCNLPLGYHHMLQSALYQLMKEKGCSESVYHDHGQCYEKRLFKCFTFGPLSGIYSIKGKRIEFEEKIFFEIRSSDAHCLNLIEYNIKQNGIQLGKSEIRDVEIEIHDDTVGSEDIVIRMASPICVYSTNPDTGYTDYWTPEDIWFSKLVQDNFRRKYTAFVGKPESEIHIEPLRVSARDKYVTRYKNYYITAWKGIYRLSGKRKYLDFLYQTGLGAKNAQGFGMFDIIDLTYSEFNDNIRSIKQQKCAGLPFL
ncbi:MAG: CRISPR-associated endoribonuclease Cas6 [Clostridium sp.]|nr:CRISPR-associated endoribonuclease Cas6 [Clostridium sp.]MCM1172869.1 CRISPR-associated endoribonuclease Cas6 [Clostridium sp.]